MGRKPSLRLEWDELANRFVEFIEHAGSETTPSGAEYLQDAAVRGVINTIRHKIEFCSGVRKTRSRLIWIIINLLVVACGYIAGFYSILIKQFVLAVIFLACSPMISFGIIFYRSLVKERWDQINIWLDKNQDWILEATKSSGLSVSWFFTKEGRIRV
jgi:hypothetical protein